MPESPRDSFDRTFPRAEWTSGLGRSALAWAVLHGVLLLCLLLMTGLVVGLFVDQGRLAVQLSGPEIATFERITGHSNTTPEAPLIPVDGEPVAVPAAADDAQTINRHFEDSGILPAVWRSRQHWWGGLLSTAYRQLPALRQNLSGLITLLCASTSLWILIVWVQAQLRATCRGAALDVSERLWRQLYRQAMRLETEDLDGSGVAGTQALFTTEIERIRTNLFEWLTGSVKLRVELAFLVLAACSVDWLLALQWTLLSILGWYVMARSQPRVSRTLETARDRAARELQNLAEALRSARLVRGFGMDGADSEQFQTRLARYVDEVRIQNRIEDNPLWLRLIAAVAAAAFATLLLLLLGVKVLAGTISPAGAVVFLLAYGRALFVLRDAGRLTEWRQDVAIAAGKVWRYLDLLPTVSQAVGAKFINPLSRTLHWDAVTYRHPTGQLLLDRLDLQVRAGRSYAVTSLNDLESRAFLFLLLRFVEPQAGRVLFDGEDIAWGTLESLRAEVVWVSADDPLLPGTVLDNIRAGRDEITLTQATEATKEARAHSFLSKLPQGYETILDTREPVFDAGQRFRLALARALLRRPAVLIIEEPRDELDEDTKQLIDDTYTRICPGRTVFFLARRLSTVRRSDDVIVLRHGRVEALGPHSLLVKESPLYRHWEYVHFHEFRHNGKAES